MGSYRLANMFAAGVCLFSFQIANATTPTISIGGIISSCTTGSHSVDGISQACATAPSAGAYTTVPGEWIEIFGANLSPVGTEILSIKFRQYTEEGTVRTVSVANDGVSYLRKQWPK